MGIYFKYSVVSEILHVLDALVNLNVCRNKQQSCVVRGFSIISQYYFTKHVCFSMGDTLL